MGKTSRRDKRNNSTRDPKSNGPNREKLAGKTSKETIKAAEEVALAAFGSGLRLAAALGSVAAKTTSFALSSLASGADKFSELVKKEAMASSRPSKESRKSQSKRRRIRRKTAKK